MYLVVSKLFSNALWISKESKSTIYLTFDDGPHPIITPWVIEQLAKFNAKATFFCIGNNAQNHPEILIDISNNGHAIGHHTQNHVHGWKTNSATYKKDVIAGNEIIQSELFRPPYGKLTWKQYRWVSKHFKLIMWSLLSKDYDKTKSPKECIKRVLSNTKAGDVIVFHDSEKAQKNLYGALPVILATLHQRGFEFAVIK